MNSEHSTILQRYKCILENSTDGFCMFDAHRRILDVSSSFCAMTGYSRDELMAMDINDLNGFEAVATPEFIEKTSAKGFDRFETSYRRKDGKLIEAEASMFAISGQDVYLAFLRDNTERKHLEAQLRQSQKMEAVGLLASGVAHDFNNLLTIIGGTSNLMLMEMDEHHPMNGAVKQIAEASDRAAELTQRLLAFSSKQSAKPQNFNLNQIILDVKKLLKRIIGEDIKIVFDIKDDPLMVHVDKGQIEQVLMNLATNARDAMPKGGLLEIETQTAEITEPFYEAGNYVPPGHYAILSVTDSGRGMDGDLRQRIFEPFFTTKDTGRGTGLGLAIVYGIVKQHNGYISVYSEQERGSSFMIFLPSRLHEQNAPVASLTSVPGSQLSGHETILVAEDEETVRKFMDTILTKFGYDVILAVDGQDAVEKFMLHRDRIEIILMDVIMPRKTGKEAYEEIRNIKSDVKILFTSGYAADILKSRGDLDGQWELIMKPTSPVELLKKLRQILG